MINGKMYVSSALIANVDVLSCRPTKVPKLIVNNTLGGNWFRQTVGTAADKAAVSLRIVGESARKAIVNYWATGADLIIGFDDLARTGFIFDEPAFELVKAAEDPASRQYSMTLNFAIVSEDVMS